MIFWTTWMLGMIAGLICLGAAMENNGRFRWFFLACSYFSMASGVIGSMLAVPL